MRSGMGGSGNVEQASRLLFFRQAGNRDGRPTFRIFRPENA